MSGIADRMLRNADRILSERRSNAVGTLIGSRRNTQSQLTRALTVPCRASARRRRASRPRPSLPPRSTRAAHASASGPRSKVRSLFQSQAIRVRECRGRWGTTWPLQTLAACGASDRTMAEKKACWLRGHGGPCSGKRNNEHYISRGLLEILAGGALCANVRETPGFCLISEEGEKVFDEC